MEEKESYNNFSNLIFRELQSILTISYGAAVAIGMLFQYHKYTPFGINIFEYADVFDFLIAPFSDPKILIYTLISLGVTASAYAADKLWINKFPKTYHKLTFGVSKKPWYAYVQAVMILTVLSQYLMLSAERYGNDIYNNIDQNATISLRFSDNERASATFIGKTSEVLFVKQGKKTIVVPISSLVKEYEIRPK